MVDGRYRHAKFCVQQDTKIQDPVVQTGGLKYRLWFEKDLELTRQPFSQVAWHLFRGSVVQQLPIIHT